MGQYGCEENKSHYLLGAAQLEGMLCFTSVPYLSQPVLQRNSKIIVFGDLFGKLLPALASTVILGSMTHAFSLSHDSLGIGRGTVC
jgi:hypothetical protein